MFRAQTDIATEGDAPLPEIPAAPATRETIHALRDAVRTSIGARLDDPMEAAQAGAMAVPACILWNQFLRFDPASPDWPDRDRFVVCSTRHRPLRDALMRLAGQSMALDDTPIDYGSHPAVEMAFGPSGQGLGAAIGMALAERQLAARFGRSIVNHRIWALSCGTELATGVAMEASSLAARMRLDRLTVLFEIAPHEEDEAEDTLARYAATGWMVRKVDADDHDAVQAALSAAIRSRKPSVLACSVTPRPLPVHPAFPPAGPASHHPAPDHSTLLWARAARRGAAARRSWLRRLVKHRQRGEFERVAAGRLPSFWREDWLRAWHMAASPVITPVSTQDAAPGYGTTLTYGRQGLDILRELVPEMLCLSSRRGRARTEVMPPDQALPDCGTLVHGLASLLNGIAVHGGLVPCGAITFVAIDRLRPALRFAAMMRRQVIYLLTDDGLALSEDGAGWLPVEQLASLRAMPNVLVFRPADRRETMECWELALRRMDGPSLITLSPMATDADMAAEPRQRRPRDGSARGGYVMEEARGPRQITLIATGSEVAIARQAQQRLARDGIGVALVSLPCWELFARQDAAYREQVLGEAPRIGIEAASGFGWDRWLGLRGAFIGMEDFGETAPSDELYRRLGITAERIHETALRLAGERGRDFQSPSGQKAESHRARSVAGGNNQAQGRYTDRNG